MISRVTSRAVGLLAEEEEGKAYEQQGYSQGRQGSCMQP